MSRQFAVFDIDGTLIRWQMYHAIVDALARRGHLSEKAYQSIRSARMQWKNRIEEDAFKQYEEQLVIAYEKVLTEIAYSQFEEAVDSVFDEYKDQVYTYTRQLIGELKESGYLLFAVSGSQAEIVSKIARHWGFDDFVGTTYEVTKNRFTGKAISHLGKKHIVINELVNKHGATYKNSFAVGDSEGDISMLEAVENPIAFNPTRKLFDHAKQKGWPIVVERKNVVYGLNPRDNDYILN